MYSYSKETSYYLGRFSRKSHTNGVDYAFSAPSGASLFGATYICPDCFDEGSRNDGTSEKTIEVNGRQIGERFGHALCAVDITGDGYDELIVGAPLHSRDNKVIIVFHFPFIFYIIKLLR